jgi:hypothetical protein
MFSGRKLSLATLGTAYVDRQLARRVLRARAFHPDVSDELTARRMIRRLFYVKGPYRRNFSTDVFRALMMVPRVEERHDEVETSQIEPYDTPVPVVAIIDIAEWI